MSTIIVDSIMGSGKSSFAINYMNKTDDRFIYITPFLSEIERVKKDITQEAPTSKHSVGGE